MVIKSRAANNKGSAKGLGKSYYNGSPENNSRKPNLGPSQTPTVPTTKAPKGY